MITKHVNRLTKFAKLFGLVTAVVLVLTGYWITNTVLPARYSTRYNALVAAFIDGVIPTEVNDPVDVW